MSQTISTPAPFVHNTLQGPGLTMERLYTTEGRHPYDDVAWERRDVVQNNWRKKKAGEGIYISTKVVVRVTQKF